jgi:hypothetical protein
MSKDASTKEHITAQHLFDRIATIIGHMFKTLQNKLRQARTERDDLQDKLEQQEDSDPLQWEKLMGYNKIEDPINMIAATMKNLAPNSHKQTSRRILLECAKSELFTSASTI